MFAYVSPVCIISPASRLKWKQTSRSNEMLSGPTYSSFWWIYAELIGPKRHCCRVRRCISLSTRLCSALLIRGNGRRNRPPVSTAISPTSRDMPHPLRHFLFCYQDMFVQWNHFAWHEPGKSMRWICLSSSVFRRVVRLVIPCSIATIFAWILAQCNAFAYVETKGYEWMHFTCPLRIEGTIPGLSSLFRSLVSSHIYWW